MSPQIITGWSIVFPPASPADCAALGTCSHPSYPDPLYSGAIAACEISAKTMTKADCIWGPAGGRVFCDAGDGRWEAEFQNGAGEWCRGYKALSPYPQGTYTVFDDECGCSGTITIDSSPV